MSNTSMVVLHSLLQGGDTPLTVFSQLKLNYFPAEYQPVFKNIYSFYQKFGKLPTLGELELNASRLLADSPILNLFLSYVPPEDVDPSVALELLVNEYAQNRCLDGIEKFLLNVTELSAGEIVEGLNTISYELAKDSDVSTKILTIQDIVSFPDEDSVVGYIPLGLNNTLDNKTLGVARGETILLGGHRGSGKSTICSNIAVNEAANGYIIPYFTIEMRADQVHRRNLGIEAGVNALSLRNNNLTQDEKDAIAQVMASKYKNSSKQLEDYYEHRKLSVLERSLKSCELDYDRGQIIIIDNPSLSLVDVDTTLTRLKSRFGDRMRMGCIDYLNQIKVPDKYDWQSQIYISSDLKEYARKHDMALVVPYQVDKNGEARFSKGILDSCDYAILLEGNQEEGWLRLKTTKARDIPPFDVTSIMDWGTLKISPLDYVRPETDESVEEDDL